MRTYLEPADVDLMEQATSCLRDRLLIRLLFRLGCRVSEVLAIKVSDIDFSNGTVMVLHLKTRIRLLCPDCKARLAKRHQFCPECGVGVKEISRRAYEHRRIRVIPVDKYTLEMLREYITQSRAICSGEALRLFNLNRHRAWQIVRDCAKRAGLPDLLNPETGRSTCSPIRQPAQSFRSRRTVDARRCGSQAGGSSSTTTDRCSR